MTLDRRRFLALSLAVAPAAALASCAPKPSPTPSSSTASPSASPKGPGAGPWTGTLTSRSGTVQPPWQRTATITTTQVTLGGSVGGGPSASPYPMRTRPMTPELQKRVDEVARLVGSVPEPPPSTGGPSLVLDVTNPAGERVKRSVHSNAPELYQPLTTLFEALQP